MRNIVLVSLLFSLAGCGGATIENSSAPVNDQVNAISADIEEGSGRNEAADPAMLSPTSGQRGLMPQEPPRGR